MKGSVFGILVSLFLFMQGGIALADELLPLCEPGNISNWKGLTADSTVEYQGKPAPKWEFARNLAIQTEQIPHDWSHYNTLEFALYSEKATGGELMVVLSSQNPSMEGYAYFATRITIDWTGWKEFSYAFTDLPPTRMPAGWNKIDSVLFSADGWDIKPVRESVLHLGYLRLALREGPGISDAELFGMLDLGYPGLEKVKAAADARDLAQAKHEFATYLRSRTKPAWNFDWKARPQHEKRPEGVDTKDADTIAAHELSSVGVSHKYEGEIDWCLNAMNYWEWPWQLNRHPFWVNLGRAYWATGDEKYAKDFVYQMTDWVKKCRAPKLVNGNMSYTWRTIEAGIRTSGSWPESFFLFLSSPSFSDEAVVTMVKSFAEHAHHLMRWPTSGNWLTMESDGLMHIGVLFPEFREAAEWRKTATSRLYAELDKQVYPDGAQIELSTGYHQVSLTNFLRAWDIAAKNDIPLPKDYVSKIERMYDYNLGVAMPDKALPGLNDAGRIGTQSAFKTALKYFPNRKDFEWMATDGEKGTKPTLRSLALPFAGHLVMRTGWEKDDLYLLFDAGPFGYGHQHEDALSMVLYAYGKYMLVDPGNYPYDSSQWRKYVLSTRAHNTIMVDGLEQNRRQNPTIYRVIDKPLADHWIAGKSFDYAAGVYEDGYGPDRKVKVRHARHIFFVRPEYWIVTDLLTPSDDQPHHYASMFHLEADNIIEDDATKGVHTANKDGINLTIQPLSDANLKRQVISGQEKPMVQGWMPVGGSKPYDVRPLRTPTFERDQAGPASFLYALYPTSEGKQCPIMAIEAIPVSAEGQAVAAAIKFEGNLTDYFAQAETAGGKLTFGEFETDAEAAFIRMKDGKVVKALLAGGTKLSRGGNPIAAEIEPIEDLSKTEQRHPL